MTTVLYHTSAKKAHFSAYDYYNEVCGQPEILGGRPLLF